MAWVAAVWLLLTAATLWWLPRNDLPNGFQNEYAHLYTLTEVHFRIRDEGLDAARSSLWDGYYPPAPHGVASAVLHATGGDRVEATASSAVWLLLWLAGTAALGRMLAGPSAGAFAVGLLAGWPSVFGTVRRYEPNAALAACVAAAGALLVSGLGNRRHAAAFGILAGLGMLSDRLVFAVYLAPLALLALVRPRPAERPRLVAALAVGLALCGWFYVRWFSIHLPEVLTQLGGEITRAGEQTGAFPAWTPVGLAWYPLAFVDRMMGLGPGVIALGGLIAWGLHGRKRVEPALRGRFELFLFGGLLLITAVSKKQPFYAIPLLAPLAAAVGAAWTGMVRGPRIAVAVAVAGLGLAQLLALTAFVFVVPRPLSGFPLFPSGLLGHEYTQAAPPHRQDLGVDRIASICRDQTAERPYTMVFSDAHGAYEGQLMPTLRLALDTRLVEGVLMAGEAVADQEIHAGCFVFVTDADERWPTPEMVTTLFEPWGLGDPSSNLLQALAAMEARSRLLERWDAGTGEAVFVYAIAPP